MKLSPEEEYANAVDKALVGEEIEGPSLPPLDNIADIQTATRGKTKVTEQETGTANVSAEDEYIDQFGNVQKMQQVSGEKFKQSPKQPLLVSQAQDAIADINAGQVQDPIQYRRKDYEHWTDEDLDTADTREEVLLASATGDVRVQKNKYTGKNQVTDGQWEDPLSGETIRHRSGIEVDHIAPLHWVNAHGGAAWSPEKKREFANDEDFLIAASKLQNQVKGASGTDKYLPPNTEYVPEYVSLWSAMLTKYPSLRMSESEAEEFAELEANVEVYKQKDAQYQAGELSIEELNKFARETFKNDVHTAAYLQKQYDRSSPDAQRQAEERSIFAEWAEANPDIKYKGSSGVAATASPLRDPSFMDKIDASFSSLNSIAQLMDMSAEWEAQRYGQNGIPRELLLKDVPEAYHADILLAAEEYNDDTALVVRDNILEDIHNNSIYDSMPWYAQLGFGAVAVIADPLTIIPAVGVAEATVGATRSIRGWQRHGAFKALPIASTWFAAGATETALQAAPKLAADYTYNSSDYILDTVAGGLLGAGMGTIVENRGLVTQFWDKAGDTKKIRELRETVDVWDDSLASMGDVERDVEIARRQSNKKLREDYADTIAQKNDKLQEELKAHIIAKTDDTVTETPYSTSEVTPDTPDTATLATEIHNGQQVLVEVKTQPGEATVKPLEEVLPNEHRNIPLEINNTLKNFRQSGELEADALARKANNPLQSLVRVLNKAGMTDLSTRLASSKSDAVKYVASRITEVPQGFGGKATRKAAAALRRDSKFRSAQMEMVPAYTESVQAYVASLGRGRLKQFRSRQEAGIDNPDVELFNREFIKLQELRRQGDSIDGINPEVVKFADSWNKSMDVSFDHLVNAGVAGFSKQRKIANYFPQSWMPARLGSMEKKHGKDKIIAVLAKGYKTAAKQTEELSDVDAEMLANRMYTHIKSKLEQNQFDDEFVSTAGQDARSKQRLNINTTAEVDGLSVMDLLDTEVVAVGTKYHNRMAGWSALSEATDGLVNSDKAVQALLESAKETGASTKELKYVSDVMEMMLGKPVRGGLSPVLREFKDLTALTQLGGKGMAQLAETGQVITRNIINAFSDPSNLNKLMKDAGIKGDASDLSKEAQQLSYMTDDMEWLERQATHVDTAETVGRVALASNWLASKITGGNRLKANAGRGLGKLSGFNMIRRSQTRITHAALSREIADQLLKGKSGMGTDRLKDLGLLDNDGKNSWMAQTMRKHATFDEDGTLVKLNFDKWPTKPAEQMRDALLRYDAQQIQRTMIGELPPWMNSPMASLLMQYMEMPLVAMNKSLGRAAAFADREAVVGVILSTMTAAIAMSGRQLVVAGSDAAAGEEFRGVDLDFVDTMKYVNAAGMWPDLYDLVLNDGYAAIQSGDSKQIAEVAMRQIPVMGLMKGYKDTLQSDDAQQLIDNAQTLTPLGNTMLGDAFFTHIMEQF